MTFEQLRAPTGVPLSLHDALPICADLTRVAPALAHLSAGRGRGQRLLLPHPEGTILLIDESYNANPSSVRAALERSEEHTSELQSRRDLVCRLLLEKKTGADGAVS